LLSYSSPQKKTHFLHHEMNRWMIQSNGVW
jgi:hypothetical protein